MFTRKHLREEVISINGDAKAGTTSLKLLNLSCLLQGLCVVLGASASLITSALRCRSHLVHLLSQMCP